MRYRVRNLGEYQHYKKRKPPWVKWHRECLDNREFMDLPDEVKWLAVLCVLLATESDDGEFDSETVEWRNRRKFSEKQAQLLVASGVLAPCKQESIPETETETETEGEAEAETLPRRKTDDGFEEWWKSLKGRVGKNGARARGPKEDALNAWKRLGLAEHAEDVMRGTRLYENTTDYPVDGVRILTKKLWKQWIEEAPPTGPVVDKTSGGVQWRGNQPQQPRVDLVRVRDLGDAIEDTGLSIGYRLKAATEALTAHKDEQDMDKLAEIARRCAWDWQKQINSEAWKKRQEQEGVA